MNVSLNVVLHISSCDFTVFFLFHKKYDHIFLHTSVVGNDYFSKSFVYFPYPSFTRSCAGMNLSAAEFMQ